MEQVPGKKNTIVDILQYHLPPEERPEFREWASGVSDGDFNVGLNAFFQPSEVKSALAEYATERLTELELFTGIRVDAVITVQDTEFAYRSYNSVAHI